MSDWTDAHQALYESELTDRELKALAGKYGAQPDPLEHLRKTNHGRYLHERAQAEAVVEAQDRRQEQRAEDERRRQLQLAEARQWAAEAQQAYFYSGRR